MPENDRPDLTTLTVELLSAYFTTNSIPSSELAGLIQSTRNALAAIDAPATAAPAVPDYLPAVSVRKSLASRDHLLSLIDGKPYKTLKRHLSGHGLTPADYRRRYNLPADYPMVAPGYSEQRRAVAQRLGLGRKRAPAVGAPDEAPMADATANGAAPVKARKPVGRPPRVKPAVNAAPADDQPKPKARRGRPPRKPVEATETVSPS